MVLVCLSGCLGHNDDAEMWFYKGIDLGNKEDKWTESIKCFDKAIEINPHFTKAWVAKGWAFNNLGKYTEGIDCFDMAIQIDSTEPYAWYGKGWALTYLNQKEEANIAFERARALGLKV